MPTTRDDGNPDDVQACWVISSSGLVTTTMTACGDVAATRSARSPTIAAFVPTRSARLMPGCRGLPAVITT